MKYITIESNINSKIWKGKMQTKFITYMAGLSSTNGNLQVIYREEFSRYDLAEL